MKPLHPSPPDSQPLFHVVTSPSLPGVMGSPFRYPGAYMSFLASTLSFFCRFQEFISWSLLLQLPPLPHGFQREDKVQSRNLPFPFLLPSFPRPLFAVPPDPPLLLQGDPHAQTATKRSQDCDFTKGWQGRGTSGWDSNTIKVAWDTPGIC